MCVQSLNTSNGWGKFLFLGRGAGGGGQSREIWTVMLCAHNIGITVCDVSNPSEWRVISTTFDDS